MALYEYHCAACGTRTEKRMPMSEVVLTVKCPSCGKRAKKAISQFAFVGKSEAGFGDGPAPWDSDGGGFGGGGDDFGMGGLGDDFE